MFFGSRAVARGGAAGRQVAGTGQEIVFQAIFYVKVTFYDEIRD
jgi:hypothetical protein